MQKETGSIILFYFILLHKTIFIVAFLFSVLSGKVVQQAFLKKLTANREMKFLGHENPSAGI